MPVWLKWTSAFLFTFFVLDAASTNFDHLTVWRRSFRNKTAKVLAYENTESAIAYFGQSTSTSFGVNNAARGLRAYEANPNGCSIDCAWGLLRDVAASGKRFGAVFWGVHAYQFCDEADHKRITARTEFTSNHSLARNLAIQLDEGNVDDTARFLFARASSIFANGPAFRLGLQEKYFYRNIKDSHRRARWHHAPPPRTPTVSVGPNCDLVNAPQAYKKRLFEDALWTLESLADRVYLVWLPDRNIFRTDDAAREGHAVFGQYLAEVAHQHPKIVYRNWFDNAAEFVAGDFRDGVHTSRRGSPKMRKRIAALFQETGL